MAVGLDIPRRMRVRVRHDRPAAAHRKLVRVRGLLIERDRRAAERNATLDRFYVIRRRGRPGRCCDLDADTARGLLGTALSRGRACLASK